MNKKLTFPELAGLLSVATNTSKRMSELFLRELFSVIAQSLIDGESVKIKNLGVFKIGEVSARRSIDVNTGKAIEIPGHKKITFTPDKNLAETVNASFSSFEAVILDDEVTVEMFDEIDKVSVQSVSLAEADVQYEEARTEIVADSEDAEVPSIVKDAIADIAKELAAVNDAESLEMQDEAELVLPDALSVAAQTDYMSQFVANENNAGDASLSQNETNESDSTEYSASERSEEHVLSDALAQDEKTAEAEIQGETDCVETEVTIPVAEVASETEVVPEVEVEGVASEAEQSELNGEIQAIEEPSLSSAVVESNGEQESADSQEHNVGAVEQTEKKEASATEGLNDSEGKKVDDGEVETESVAYRKLSMDEQRKELNERYNRVRNRERNEENDSWYSRNKLGVGFGLGVIFGALLIFIGMWCVNNTNVIEYFDSKEIVEHVDSALVIEAELVADSVIPDEPEEPAKVITDTVRTDYYLARMADKYYGDAHYWVYIYEENKSIIKNPNKVTPGTVVVIPPAEKYGIDKNDAKSLEEAERKAKEVLSAY